MAGAPASSLADLVTQVRDDRTDINARTGSGGRHDGDGGSGGYSRGSDASLADVVPASQRDESLCLLAGEGDRGADHPAGNGDTNDRNDTTSYAAGGHHEPDDGVAPACCLAPRGRKAGRFACFGRRSGAGAGGADYATVELKKKKKTKKHSGPSPDGARKVHHTSWPRTPPAEVKARAAVPALLPPQLGSNVGKKVLVIDLDETLVHSSFVPVVGADLVIHLELTDTCGQSVHHPVYVMVRPGVSEFLETMARDYELVVFTASLATYADPVIDLVDAADHVSHRLYRDSCVMHAGSFVKDLSLLGRDMRDVMLIDNSPFSYALQPHHAIPISSWFDDSGDRVLLSLIPMLQDLAAVDDVTDILRYKKVSRGGDYVPPGPNAFTRCRTRVQRRREEGALAPLTGHASTASTETLETQADSPTFASNLLVTNEAHNEGQKSDEQREDKEEEEEEEGALSQDDEGDDTASDGGVDLVLTVRTTSDDESPRHAQERERDAKISFDSKASFIKAYSMYA